MENVRCHVFVWSKKARKIHTKTIVWCRNKVSSMFNRSIIVAIVAWVRAYLVDDELSGVGPEQARFLNRLRALPSSARHTVTPAWLQRATRREQRTRTRTKRGQRYRRGSGEWGRGKVLIDNASHVFALVPLRSTVGAKGKLHHCGGGGSKRCDAGGRARMAKCAREREGRVKVARVLGCTVFLRAALAVGRPVIYRGNTAPHSNFLARSYL